MREIITDWATTGAAPGLSIMYFDDTTASAEAQREALFDFWDALASLRVTTSRFTVRTTGRVIRPLDGGLVGEWTAPTARTGVGTAGTNQVANATQLLVRWNTGEVADGRFVKGRQYIPGISALAMSNGEPLPATNNTLVTAAQTFLNELVGFGVWHRPKAASGGDPGRDGRLIPATVASGWGEFAVLKRRRR